MPDATAESIHAPSGAPIWLSLIPGPLIWAIQAVANYLLAQYACASETAVVAIHAIGIAALAVLALCTVSARRKYKAVSVQSDNVDVDFWPPERWVPAAGFILCAAFFVVTLAETIPPFILNRCE
jgi:hypothetical protein